MIKPATLVVTVCAAGLLCLAASAQDNKAPAPKKETAAKKKSAGSGMPAMPKPGAEMKELEGFIGTWTTDEAYEAGPMMPTAGTGTGTNRAYRGPGGFSILMNQTSKSAMGNYMGHGVLLWDANDKAYKMVWVDSMMPGVIVETGKKDGDNLVFTGETMMMGKKTSLRDVISDRTPTSYTLTSYMNDGSGEKKVMTSKATKQEAPATAKKEEKK